MHKTCLQHPYLIVRPRSVSGNVVKTRTGAPARLGVRKYATRLVGPWKKKIPVFSFQDFLLREEKDGRPPATNHVKSANGYELLANAYGRTGPNGIYGQTGEQQPAGVVVTNATAKWSDGQADNSLENINLTLRRGKLVAIIGPVGAGKVRPVHTYITYHFTAHGIRVVF